MDSGTCQTSTASPAEPGVSQRTSTFCWRVPLFIACKTSQASGGRSRKQLVEQKFLWSSWANFKPEWTIPQTDSGIQGSSAKRFARACQRPLRADRFAFGQAVLVAVVGARPLQVAVAANNSATRREDINIFSGDGQAKSSASPCSRLRRFTIGRPLPRCQLTFTLQQKRPTQARQTWVGRSGFRVIVN